jgi:uncharacterized protein YjbI with pentapeptide repeats
LEGATLDDCVLRRIVARRANLKFASMRRVDAARADLRGESLAGAAVHGASFRRANAARARMAGMWGGPSSRQPKIKAGDDAMLDPLNAADADVKKWATEKAAPVDAAKEAEEDAEDEMALAAWKESVKESVKSWGMNDEVAKDDAANVLNLQKMNATCGERREDRRGVLLAAGWVWLRVLTRCVCVCSPRTAGTRICSR